MPRITLALLIAAVALASCQPATPTSPGSPAASAPAASSPAPAAGTVPASAAPASPAPVASTAPAAGLRTYATTIKPITSGQGCRSCHAATQAGSSYEFDKGKAATIVRMAQSNGTRAALTPAQIADVQAWFAAGSPNDPTSF
jgi:hypothetical protein